MTTTDLMPTAGGIVPADLDARMRFVTALADAGALPPAFRKRPADLLLVASYADALGLPFATALQTLFVVDGKVTLSAQLVASLVRRAGHRLRTDTSHDADGRPSVTARVARSDDPDWEAVSTWDVARAERAGLAGKDTWRRYPEQMLRARATVEAAREACPEVLGGLYLADEVERDAPVQRATAQRMDDDALAGPVQRGPVPADADPWAVPAFPGTDADDAVVVDDADDVPATLPRGVPRGRASRRGDGASAYASVRRALGTPDHGDTRRPTDRQLAAVNARMREAGCCDTVHRGWAVAALLDRQAWVESLRQLSRDEVSQLLDMPADRVAEAVAVTAGMPHPDDADDDGQPDAGDAVVAEDGDDTQAPDDGPPARPRLSTDGDQ